MAPPNVEKLDVSVYTSPRRPHTHTHNASVHPRSSNAPAHAHVPPLPASLCPCAFTHPLAGGTKPGDRLLLVDDSTQPLADGANRTIRVPLASQPDPILGMALKVTLVWSDPPANPFVRDPLVNDLDLHVALDDGREFVGNCQQTAGGCEPGGAVDTANTVEQVAVAAVAMGSTATITVRAGAGGNGITQGPQRFALVVTGPLAITSSPPPAPRRSPPPAPPFAPAVAASVSAEVVVGVTLPLLAVGLGAGALFFYRRRNVGGDDGVVLRGGAGPGGSIGQLSLPRGSMLPTGWKQLKDPKSGAAYYLDQTTGITQWHPPPPHQVRKSPPTHPSCLLHALRRSPRALSPACHLARQSPCAPSV